MNQSDALTQAQPAVGGRIFHLVRLLVKYLRLEIQLQVRAERAASDTIFVLCHRAAKTAQLLAIRGCAKHDERHPGRAGGA